MAIAKYVSQIHSIRIAIAFLLMGSVAACASLDVKTNYEPPKHTTIPSSMTVDKPFDEAWDSFVRNISQSFFVVNNITKESHLINISVGRSRAAEFVDCGKVTYTVNSKKWTFNPAKNATFNDSGFRSETTVYHRVSGSGGRMNIFVAPNGASTTFEVNTSYFVEMQQSGRTIMRNMLGRIIDSQDWPQVDESYRFTTKEADKRPFGDVLITCQATGVWEQLVLDLAR